MGSRCSVEQDQQRASISAAASQTSGIKRASDTRRASETKGQKEKHHHKHKGKPQLQVPNLNKTKFEDEYKTGRPHGIKVTEVKNLITMQIFASYKLPKNKFPCKNGEEISKRIKKLQEIEHPNVCRLIEAFDDHGCVYIIYQNVGGKTIVDEINASKNMSEQKAADIGRQIVRALNCTIANGLIHGSLVPKNILVQPSGGIIVTDVGLIDLVKEDEITKVNRASFSFLAPELLKPWFELQQTDYAASKGLQILPMPDESKTAKSAPNDIWSAGAIFFFLLTGKPPFAAKFAVDIAAGVINADPFSQNTKMEKVSREAQILITNMLSKKASDRPKAEFLLKHPWLMEANKDKLSSAKLDKEVFANFASLNKETHFKKFLMKMVAQNLPPRKVKELENNFNKADLNGDGFITLDELKRFVSSQPDISEFGFTEDDAEDVFNTVDADGGGTISLSEFIAATLDSQEVLVQGVLRDAWRALDKDQDGKITKKEMKAVVKEVESRMGKPFIKELLKKIDSEIKGELTFVEFCEMATEEGAVEERQSDSSCFRLLRPCRNMTFSSDAKAEPV